MTKVKACLARVGDDLQPQMLNCIWRDSEPIRTAREQQVVTPRESTHAQSPTRSSSTPTRRFSRTRLCRDGLESWRKSEGTAPRHWGHGPRAGSSPSTFTKWHNSARSKIAQCLSLSMTTPRWPRASRLDHLARLEITMQNLSMLPRCTGKRSARPLTRM